MNHTYNFAMPGSEVNIMGGTLEYHFIAASDSQVNIAGTVAVRRRDGKVKYGVKIDDFVKQILTEIEKKA